MIPFPLASGRYEVGPGMRRFGQAGQGLPAEAGHFQPDEQLAATLAAKLAVLRQAPDEAHLYANEADAERLGAALRACFGLLASEHPHLASVDAVGVTLHHLGLRLAGWTEPRLERIGPGFAPVAAEIQAWLAGRSGLPLLADALGLAVQEDLAILHGPTEAGADRLEWLHVCLPSNWVPAEKIGGSFIHVHTPVVHSERLIVPQAQLVRAMLQGGPFVRYVWGIHRDGVLCHNPRIHQAPPWDRSDPLAQAHLRVERQTTHGFPGLNRALFTIRYWVEPLTVTAADPYRRERLLSALAGMDAAEQNYKGLTLVRDRLVAQLSSY